MLGACFLDVSPAGKLSSVVRAVLHCRSRDLRRNIDWFGSNLIDSDGNRMNFEEQGWNSVLWRHLLRKYQFQIVTFVIFPLEKIILERKILNINKTFTLDSAKVWMVCFVQKTDSVGHIQDGQLSSRKRSNIVRCDQPPTHYFFADIVSRHIRITRLASD